MNSNQSKRKYSRQRDAILRAICATDCHPSAAWVYERVKPEVPGLSLGTVYRNINLLKKEGTVMAVGVIQGEERIDGRTHPHSHFFCERCNRVFDLPALSSQAIALFSELSEFEIDLNKTAFYGLCPACRAK